MGQFGRTFSHIDIFLITLQVILFEIDCAIFYTNSHELFCQLLNIMADMKKVYDDLIVIINL